MMKITKIRTGQKRGFGLIELIVVIVIIAVVMALTLPLLTDLVAQYRGRMEIERCDEVVRKTTSESLVRSLPSNVFIDGDTIIGEVIESDGALTQVAEYQLQHGAFGRTNGAATPWLNSAETGPTNFGANNHVIPFNGFGTISPIAGQPDGAVILYSINENVSVIEILQSGLIDVFHQPKGEDEWTQ